MIGRGRSGYHCPEIDRRSALFGIGATVLTTFLPSERRRQAPPRYLNVRDFGAQGDGETDASTAIQDAIEASARERTPLLLPEGEYLVRKTIRAASNLVLEGSGATLITAIDEYGDSGRPVPTLQIDDVRNVTIRKLRIDGRGSEFDDHEFKHCVSINGSDSVLIEDCEFFDAKGDGLILNDIHPGIHNSNIVVRRTVCRGNFRLGLAVTDASNASFEDCTFNDNRGTAPMGGANVEPDRDDCVVENIEFVRCDMSNNGIRDVDGAGFRVSLRGIAASQQREIRLVSCTMGSNGIHGVLIHHAQDLLLVGCAVVDNGSSGIEVLRSSSDIVILGGAISQNAIHGLSAVRDADQILSGMQVRHVAIHDNSRSAPNKYDGIHLFGDCREVVISNCTINGSHRYGIRIADTATDVTLKNNDLSGNSVGPMYPPATA